MNRKKLEKLFIICILTAFTGQIYLNPFSSGFRFSFSVSALSLMLIFFKDIPIMTATNAVGISIFLFRTFVYLIGNPGADISSAVILYAPGAIFYFLYGILFQMLNVRDKSGKGENIILSLWLCDSISNIIEVAVRKSRIDHPFEIVVLVLILMGLMRSIITIAVYEVINYYMHRYEREQKDRKYKELILFMASLKSELFFLRKSIVDIEEAMRRSYRLYEQVQDRELKDEALMVAKDIHEVKKDYIRVVSGIEKTLSEEDKSLYMSVKEIYHIIKDNTEKLIEMNEKNILLRFKYQQNFITRDYYQLISVLNNLIINAIDAIEETGIISITQEVSGKTCLFKVRDNGKGIDKSDLDLIFEPGFSTKFNPVTGEMSTGIGLTHVKHIIEKHFSGHLEVSSSKDGGTTFTIQIPLSNITV
ncbi:ATP-binding protein [Anaerosolibacter carboniphilus]|uniref:ATP-binding protein n=1 Tax=Anaerosolibacter carboniphilus TaxID=1417629 RepID=UPI002ED5A3A8